MRTDLEDAIRSSRDAMVDFTRELVRIPTENPPGRDYRAAVDLIAGLLSETGLEPRVVEVPGSSQPCFSLLAGHGSGERTLWFHGHYDVVPAARQDQFEPRLAGGNLFGRGSSDMKSGIAAMIYAVKAIREHRPDLRGRIGLCIVPDEETGGAGGSRHLAEAGLLGVRGDGMLTPEPTGGVIWNANRGAVSLRVTVRGKPAHVGLHYKGVNAFEGMVRVANALADLKAEVESRLTAFRIEPDAARRSILMIGGRCEGGSSFNLVPAECSFTVDRRINPEEDLAEEKTKLLGVFERMRREGIDLDVEVLQEGAASGAAEDDPLAVALARSVEEISGRPAPFELCPGLLEIRFYAEKGVPAFAYGPGLLSVSHGPDEFVKVKDIVACAVVYAMTAIRYFEPEALDGRAPCRAAESG